MSALVAPVVTFGEMNLPRKLLFIVQFCVFLVTFGFVFPLLLSN